MDSMSRAKGVVSASMSPPSAALVTATVLYELHCMAEGGWQKANALAHTRSTSCVRKQETHSSGRMSWLRLLATHVKPRRLPDRSRYSS